MAYSYSVGDQTFTDRYSTQIIKHYPHVWIQASSAGYRFIDFDVTYKDFLNKGYWFSHEYTIPGDITRVRRFYNDFGFSIFPDYSDYVSTSIGGNVGTWRVRILYRSQDLNAPINTLPSVFVAHMKHNANTPVARIVVDIYMQQITNPAGFREMDIYKSMESTLGLDSGQYNNGVIYSYIKETYGNTLMCKTGATWTNFPVYSLSIIDNAAVKKLKKIWVKTDASWAAIANQQTVTSSTIPESMKTPISGLIPLWEEMI